MDFNWNFATVLVFFVGIVIGALLQHYIPLGGKPKKNEKCPHCGKSLEPK